MSTSFINQGIWPALTQAISASPGKCLVAVAYFGKGAAKLLPLKKGSRLVVDASEAAVKSGKTFPADLEKLRKAGVEVFSVPNLHAKVFVVGNTAFIGSTNASNHSASHLIEAVIRTNEGKAVSSARNFVKDQCLISLGPEALEKLAKIYRPPQFPGNGKSKAKSSLPVLPRLFLAQLSYEDWPEKDQATHDSGKKVAEKHQQHKATHVLDSFRWHGKCPFLPKDRVIQVMNEGNGRFLMAPDGEVLHLRKVPNTNATFVYLERPTHKRRQLTSVAKAAGCTHKALRKQGKVTNSKLVHSLLRTWNQ